MEQGLFRPEAIASRADRAFGNALLNAPPSFAWCALGALALLGALIWLASAGEFSRKESVPGFLVPDAGLVNITAPMAGFVTRRPAREGMRVEAGAELAVIASARSNAQDRDVDAALIRRLDERERGLRRQRAEEAVAAEMERALAIANRTGLEREVETTSARLALERERAHLSERRLAELLPVVALGHLPRAQFDQANDEHLARLAGLRELERTLALLERQARASSHEAGAAESRLRARLADLDARLAALAQERVEIAARAEAVIRAPIAGRLTAVAVREGQQVMAGQSLFVVIPESGELHARLLVPTRSAGFVTVGQPVGLRFEAFPHQRFGMGSGQVSQVPTAVVGAGEPVGPLRASEPVYLVDVAITADTMQAYGREWPLRSGMLLEADLKVGRQRILDLVLDPIRSLRGRL